jgi:CheY-like chemotaxis protein
LLPLRILIADDDSINRRLMHRFLSKLGYGRSTLSAEENVRACRQQGISVAQSAIGTNEGALQKVQGSPAARGGRGGVSVAAAAASGSVSPSPADYVDSVENGLEVVERMKQMHYDLVLCDMQMPKCSGIEAAKRILHWYRTGQQQQQQQQQQSGCGPPLRPVLPVIVALTANTLDEHKEQCYEAGMSNFMSKPFSIKALGTMLAMAGQNIYAQHERHAQLATQTQTQTLQRQQQQTTGNSVSISSRAHTNANFTALSSARGIASLAAAAGASPSSVSCTGSASGLTPFHLHLGSPSAPSSFVLNSSQQQQQQQQQLPLSDPLSAGAEAAARGALVCRLRRRSRLLSDASAPPTADSNSNSPQTPLAWARSLAAAAAAEDAASAARLLSSSFPSSLVDVLAAPFLSPAASPSGQRPSASLSPVPAGSDDGSCTLHIRVLEKEEASATTTS